MSSVVSPILMLSIVSESERGLEVVCPENADRRVRDCRAGGLVCCQSRSRMVVILIGLDLSWRRTGLVELLVSWRRPHFIWVICGGGHCDDFHTSARTSWSGRLVFTVTELPGNSICFDFKAISGGLLPRLVWCVLTGSVASFVVAGIVLLSLRRDIVLLIVLLYTVISNKECASFSWTVESSAH